MCDATALADMNLKSLPYRLEVEQRRCVYQADAIPHQGSSSNTCLAGRREVQLDGTPFKRFNSPNRFGRTERRSVGAGHRRMAQGYHEQGLQYHPRMDRRRAGKRQGRFPASHGRKHSMPWDWSASALRLMRHMRGRHQRWKFDCGVCLADRNRGREAFDMGLRQIRNAPRRTYPSPFRADAPPESSSLRGQ